MAEFKIALGETDGFRFIGVMPPATREISQSLQGLDNTALVHIKDRTLESGESYTEVGFMTGEFTAGDMLVAGLARKLVDEGNTVTITDAVEPLGQGHFLFVDRVDATV